MADNGEKKYGEWLRFLLGVAIASLLGYMATTNAVNARLSVLETKQETDRAVLGDLKVELRTLSGEIRTLNGKVDVLLARQP